MAAGMAIKPNTAFVSCILQIFDLMWCFTKGGVWQSFVRDTKRDPHSQMDEDSLFEETADDPQSSRGGTTRIYEDGARQRQQQETARPIRVR